MELQRIALEAVTGHVTCVLPGFPNVSGAYLFGSSLGACRPDSDIDLGLILSADPAHILEDTTDVEVEAALGALEGHPYHVTTLLAEAVTFSFNAISRGRLIYRRDPARIGDFVANVCIAHDDLLPFLDTYRRERERMLNGFP